MHFGMPPWAPGTFLALALAAGGALPLRPLLHLPLSFLVFWHYGWTGGLKTCWQGEGENFAKTCARPAAVGLPQLGGRVAQAGEEIKAKTRLKGFMSGRARLGRSRLYRHGRGAALAPLSMEGRPSGGRGCSGWRGGGEQARGPRFLLMNGGGSRGDAEGALQRSGGGLLAGVKASWLGMSSLSLLLVPLPSLLLLSLFSPPSWLSVGDQISKYLMPNSSRVFFRS